MAAVKNGGWVAGVVYWNDNISRACVANMAFDIFKRKVKKKRKKKEKIKKMKKK